MPAGTLCHYLGQELTCSVPFPPRRFITINAWNEWGEGPVLEPSNRFGREYLQAIREALLQSKGPAPPGSLFRRFEGQASIPAMRRLVERGMRRRSRDGPAPAALEAIEEED